MAHPRPGSGEDTTVWQFRRGDGPMLGTPARQRLLQALLVSLLTFGIALLLGRTPLLEGVENVTWAWRVKLMAKPGPATAQIKLILIDQASLDWAKNDKHLSWQWPRETYAWMLEFCQRSGARVVAMDMIYSEPSSYHALDDQTFGLAVQKSGTVVVGFFTGAQTASATNWPAPPHPAWRTNVLARDADVQKLAKHCAPFATFPIPEVATNAALLATVTADLDRDGVLRRIPPFRLFDGGLVPLLSVGAYLAEIKTNEQPAVIQEILSATDAHGRLIPRFRGKSGTHEVFGAGAILQSELLLREGLAPTISTNALRGCHVFIGVSAPALKDLRPTPVSGDYPGVEIHATVLDNLLSGDLIKEAPVPPILISTLLLAMLASVLIGSSRGFGRGLMVFIVCASLPFAAGFIAYANGYWWPVAQPAATVGLALSGTLIWYYATEGRQRRFLKSAFRHYLSPEVIESMLQNPEQLKLGGEKRVLTMMFSDLEKFSSFSERLEPTVLTALLNDYLTDMTRIILEEGGTVDKYVGDAIVAFWNAPLSQSDHAARACRAALRCQQQLEQRRMEFSVRAGAPFRMRIGINTGEVTVGNLGSESRFNYTVLGDAANLASRLEGANKFFGTFTLASETTWELVKGMVAGRELGAIRVLGRAAPVRVYELQEKPGTTQPELPREFERGLTLCRNKQWAEAEAIFIQYPDDPVSALYGTQCRKLRTGELSDWDAVWNLMEK